MPSRWGRVCHVLDLAHSTFRETGGLERMCSFCSRYHAEQRQSCMNQCASQVSCGAAFFDWELASGFSNGKGYCTLHLLDPRKINGMTFGSGACDHDQDRCHVKAGCTTYPGMVCPGACCNGRQFLLGSPCGACTPVCLHTDRQTHTTPSHAHAPKRTCSEREACVPFPWPWPYCKRHLIY